MMTRQNTGWRPAVLVLQLALCTPFALLLGALLVAAIRAEPFVVAYPPHHHQAPAAESCYGAYTNYGC